MVLRRPSRGRYTNRQDRPPSKPKYRSIVDRVFGSYNVTAKHKVICTHNYLVRSLMQLTTSRADLVP